MIHQLIQYLDVKIMDRYHYFFVNEKGEKSSPTFYTKEEAVEWWNEKNNAKRKSAKMPL